jgi:hypothetical protein
MTNLRSDCVRLESVLNSCEGGASFWCVECVSAGVRGSGGTRGRFSTCEAILLLFRLFMLPPFARVRVLVRAREVFASNLPSPIFLASYLPPSNALITSHPPSSPPPGCLCSQHQVRPAVFCVLRRGSGGVFHRSAACDGALVSAARRAQREGPADVRRDWADDDLKVEQLCENGRYRGNSAEIIL